MGEATKKWGEINTNQINADNLGSAAEAETTDFAPIAHVGAGDDAHSLVTDAADGFMAKEEHTKLAGVEDNANDYTHPTGEGYKHVPAIVEGDVDKQLAAGEEGPYWKTPVVTGDMLADTYDPIIKAITGESTVGATPDTTLAAIASRRDVKIPVLINPAADAISVPVYFETAATLYKVVLTSTKAVDATAPPTSSSIFTTPSASTTINVYGLSGSTVTEIDTNAMTTASLSHTLDTPASIPAGSWVFIKIVGAVNGVTCLAAGLVVG